MTRHCLIFALVLAFAAVVQVRSSDIKTTLGLEYKNATISRIEPDGIVVLHSSGVVKIPFPELSPELQKKYGYNPQAAEAFQQKNNAAAEQLARAIADEKERRREANQPASPAPTAPFPRETASPAANGAVHTVATNSSKVSPAASAATHSETSARGFQDASSALPPITKLTLEANETATGVLTDHLWETTWGSYDRRNHASKRIRVIVRDVSRRLSEAMVDVYFIARPLPSGRRFIYGHHTQPVQMNGRIEAIGEIDAPVLKSHIINYALSRSRYASGAEIDGWIVTAKLRGQVAAVRASTQTLLEIAEDNPRQTERLEDMEDKTPQRPKR